jgi:hypothetical protein
MNQNIIKCVLIVSLFFCVSAQAQDKNDKIYTERSAEVKKEIWGEKNAAFETTNIPAEYKDESAVIVAKSVFYSQDKKNKVKLTLFGPSFKNSRNNYITTIREKVKINDQSALEEYATLEYRKQIDKTTSFGLFSKNLDKAFTFIGVKITKPNGAINELNMDEEVLTKDEKKKKDGKIAISGLQIGDFVEYYIRVEEVQDNYEKTMGPYFFVMGGDHPILDLSVKFIIDKKAGIACKAVNGAPEFKQSISESGDFMLELQKNNLPKVLHRMWQMPYRQLPYIVLSYKTEGGSKKPYIGGAITKNLTQEDYLKEIEPILDQIVKEYTTPYEITGFMDRLSSFTAKCSDTKLSKMPKDSLAINLFYVWQHYWGYHYGRNSYSPTAPSTADCSTNDYSLYNFLHILALHKLMQKLEIDNELVVITPVNSPKTEDILNYGDYDLLLRTKGAKPIYFNMDNRFNNPFEVPIRFQGQNATLLDVDLKKGFFGKSNTYNRTTDKISYSKAEDNVNQEDLKVTFNQASISIAEIDRTVATSGHYRAINQMQLCLPEETEKRNAKTLGVNDIITQLNESKSSKKTATEFEKVYAEAKSNWKDDFKDEIKEQYNQEPKEIISYDITNYALRYWDKYFVFTEKFTMEGWMKKAGNNYLFEAGKLIGIYTRIDDKERDRKIDIYMPCARTFSFSITINIPEGYTAKGIEAFNKNITNNFASFVATATLQQNKIIITAKRTFNNAFEPAANWSKLVEVMDACTDFTGQKILFEKNK